MLRHLGRLWLLSAALFMLLGITPAVSSEPAVNTFYVDPVNGNDASGTGSAAAPWRSLNRALQTAASGDTIAALPGTYSTATGEVFPISWPPAVKLIGAGRDVAIVQGQSDQPVIYIGSASTDFYSDTLISGVTVRGGSEGIYLYSSQSHVNATTLLSLRAISNTNGIRIRTSEVYHDGAVITSLISDTEALSNTNQGFYFSGYGYFSASEVRPELVNCVSRKNGAHGLYLDSAAVSSNGTTVAPHVVASDFSDNHGSGVYATASYMGWTSPVIERSTITGNGAYGFRWMWGINYSNAAPVIINTLIARNHAGGLYLDPTYGGSGSLDLINDTIADNDFYGLYWVEDAHALWPHIVNTILWNPQADDIFPSGAGLTTTQVEYSDIKDGDFNGLAGNFSLNPELDETYHLFACSPAIDAGTASFAPPTDFDGEPRPQGTAPDVGMDELGLPCVLRSAKTASASQVHYGDVFTYTLQITNVSPITTLAVALTDALPGTITYVPDSLSASQGTPQYQSGIVTWNGSLIPSATLSITLAVKAISGHAIVTNRFTTDVADFGLFRSPSATTEVGPFMCYLPAINRNYCTAPFIDNFSNPASGWPSAETATWSYGYTGGEYRLYAKQPATAVVTRGDKTGRLIVEVAARQVSTVNGSFGIVFQLDDNWSQFFTFEIYPATQEWALFEFIGNQWHVRAYGGSSAIHPGHSTNLLRVAWVQQTVSSDDYGLYVNGQQVFYLSYISAPTPVRRVGLTATSDGAGFEVRFDNYKFVAEGCPEFPAAQVSRAAVARHDQPSFDQLPTVWQERLHAKNSFIPRASLNPALLPAWTR